MSNKGVKVLDYIQEPLDHNVNDVGGKKLEELVLCKCSSAQHQMIIRAFERSGFGMCVYLTIHLAPLPIWQRIKQGIKYIFGHRCVFGDFEEVVLRPSDAPKFEKVVQWLKQAD